MLNFITMRCFYFDNFIASASHYLMIPTLLTFFLCLANIHSANAYEKGQIEINAATLNKLQIDPAKLSNLNVPPSALDKNNAINHPAFEKYFTQPYTTELFKDNFKLFKQPIVSEQNQSLLEQTTQKEAYLKTLSSSPFLKKFSNHQIFRVVGDSPNLIKDLRGMADIEQFIPESYAGVDRLTVAYAWKRLKDVCPTCAVVQGFDDNPTTLPTTQVNISDKYSSSFSASRLNIDSSDEKDECAPPLWMSVESIQLEQIAKKYGLDFNLKECFKDDIKLLLKKLNEKEL
ncbi:hypothetical protein HG263_04900 [Pseudoalteromonas sp. JBTF-M23]|uniref:Uncharacterized protein n=1 Tax=Pseudoalteromonas caenipelagi TaxID=2726988 RepID=A0A849VBA6_9GAMM|nr:hypothetical protein [Pseudoalteromonas caenipelagi]NOU49873.1 hypothetical protein [Pseudoalteromonas caenipelagi]